MPVKWIILHSGWDDIYTLYKIDDDEIKLTGRCKEAMWCDWSEVIADI